MKQLWQKLLGLLSLACSHPRKQSSKPSTTVTVFGYTVTKEVVPVVLPATEVVELGINPFRVDLFNPQPIRVNINGETLHFSALDNITFALVECESRERKKKWWQRLLWWRRHTIILDYHLGKGTIVQLANGQATCIQGDTNMFLGGKNLWISTASLTALPLEEGANLWLQFLTGARQELVATNGGVSLKQGNIQFQGNTTSMLFAGEMFAPLQLACPLLDAVNWVFQAFGGWNPRVFGGCLRDTILGVPFNDVDFMIDCQSADNITVRLKAMGAEDIKDITNNNYGQPLGSPIFAFTYQGTSYHLVCRGGNVLTDDFWAVTDFSVNQLTADKPNRVTASRICLYDLAHRQFRLVSQLAKGSSSSIRSHWPERAHNLSSNRGLRPIPNDFATDEYDAIAPSKKASSSSIASKSMPGLPSDKTLSLSIDITNLALG